MTGEVRRVFVCVFELHESYSTQDYVRRAGMQCLNSEYRTIVSHADSTDDLFEIRRTPQGKPCFVHLPEVGLSVSHSGDYIVCALADGNIGVDIERGQKYPDESDADFSRRLCTIAGRFFHPDEAAYIREDPLTRFNRIFTAKESYVKMTGTGFDETLGCHSVLPADAPELPCADGTPVIWRSADAQFWQTEYREGYTLCICANAAQTPYSVCMM